MFYKGYKFHIFILIIIASLILFFFLQIRYINAQLRELESINKFLYKHLLDGHLNLNHFELIANFDTDNKSVFRTIDSIITKRLQEYYTGQNIDYIITNHNYSLLYASKKNLEKSNIKLPDKYYFEAAKIDLGKNKQLKILIPDKIKRKNETILLFYKLLWFTLCIVSVGFVVFMWEKQRRLQKIRLDIINNMSHEFKTPLTSIQLVSEMIMQQGHSLKEDKLKHYAGIIHQESNKMLQQATHILNSAYYDQSKFVLRKRQYNVHGLLDFILKSYTTVFSPKEINITTNFKATNPYVSVDRNHFVNVITNLLDNARKYAKKNHVDVTITTHNEGSRLFIDIEDNGIGIEPKYHKLIFDRFFRVPSGNIHEKSGYGVGLFYVKTILKQMNAHIKVKSKLSHGTVFTISMKTIQKKPCNNKKT